MASQVQIADPENAQNPITHTPRGTGFSANGVVQKVKTNLIFRSKWEELNWAMGDLGTYIPVVLLSRYQGPQSWFQIDFHWNLQRYYRCRLWGPHACSAHEVHCRRGHFRRQLRLAGDHGCRNFNRWSRNVIGVTGLMQLVYKLIPLCYGNSVGTGLVSCHLPSLRLKYIRKVQHLPKSKSLGNREWFGLDGLVLTFLYVCFIVIVNGAGEDHAGCDAAEENNAPSYDLGDQQFKKQEEQSEKDHFLASF